VVRNEMGVYESLMKIIIFFRPPRRFFGFKSRGYFTMPLEIARKMAVSKGLFTYRIKRMTAKLPKQQI